MTFGRPPLIPNSYMGDSIPLNITFGLGQTAYGLAGPTRMNPAGSDLFLQTWYALTSPVVYRELPRNLSTDLTSKLNLILGDVIETIYGCNIENSLSSNLLEQQRHIIRIEGRLSDWRNQLPSSCHLLDLLETRNIQLPEGDLRERRTVAVLSLRYLNLRSLLHRSSIYRLLDPTPRSQDCRELPILHYSVNLCVESSVSSIKIISHAVRRQEILPIWWFSAYYSESKAC